MAKSDDITIFMTSDGLEWGQFLAGQLDAFKGKVTYRTLQLDDMEYENPTEVTHACTNSLVVLLLASPDTLNYMHEKAGWFSLTMQTVPATSAVVVVTLMGKEDVDRYTASTYDTSRWTYKDPGHRHEDVQQMVADILDIVDRCRHSKPKEPSISRSSSRPKLCVKLFPSTVYEVRDVTPPHPACGDPLTCVTSTSQTALLPVHLLSSPLCQSRWTASLCLSLSHTHTLNTNLPLKTCYLAHGCTKTVSPDTWCTEVVLPAAQCDGGPGVHGGCGGRGGGQVRQERETSCDVTPQLLCRHLPCAR